MAKQQQPKQKEKSQTKSVAVKKSAIDKFQAKHKNPLKKVAFKTIDKKSKPKKANNQNAGGLSDERLKAFGINPKKFIKQQKYASQKNQQNANKKSQKPAPNSKQANKLKSKLKKALKV